MIPPVLLVVVVAESLLQEARKETGRIKMGDAWMSPFSCLVLQPKKLLQ
jgi:hypothetical protein